MGGRYDRGDAETGWGPEAGAELGLVHAGSGLSLDARGRMLLIHQDRNFKEWGAAVALRVQPGREDRGLSFSLEPSWGNASGGAQTLWQGGADVRRSAGAPGLGAKPFGRWSREGAAGYRLNVGTQWATLGGQTAEQDPGLRLVMDFFGEQAADGFQPPKRRVGVVGTITFK